MVYSDARLAVWRIGAPAQVDSVLRFNHSRKHYEAWKGSYLWQVEGHEWTLCV